MFVNFFSPVATIYQLSKILGWNVVDVALMKAGIA
jgi:hypothetical protein